MKKLVKIATLSFILSAGLVNVPSAVAGGDDETRVFELGSALVRFKVWVLGVLPVKGQFRTVKGSLVTDNASNRTAVEVSVDASSIDTEDADRDALLRGSKFFDVDRFPEVLFQASRLEQDTSGKQTLVGQLQLRGRVREVMFDVLPGQGGYTASTVISRSAFGMKGMPVAVSDAVLVQITLPDLEF